MINKKEKKALISNLPENWRAQGMEKFLCSQSFIEKVAYGITENLEVFEWLVELAETNRQSIATKKQELKDRLQNLTKPIAI